MSDAPSTEQPLHVYDQDARAATTKYAKDGYVAATMLCRRFNPVHVRALFQALYEIDGRTTEDMLAMHGGFIGGLDAHVAREAEGGAFEPMFKIWWAPPTPNDD